MKKIMLIISILITAVSAFSQTAVEPAFVDGKYQIASLENLYWIAAPDSVVPVPDHFTRLSSNYIQVSDINASETKTWFSGRGWLPIGNYVSDYYGNPTIEESFNGTFNGQLFTIDSLYINRNTDLIGLFSITSNSHIENINFLNADITGVYYVGGITGFNFYNVEDQQENNLTIFNCHVAGSISGSYFVGGIAGESAGAKISSCANSSTVSCTEYYVGGICGYFEHYDVSNNYSTIEKCFNTGSISGFSSVGGIAGRNMHGYMYDCYNAGSVTGDQYVGGLIGLHAQLRAYFDFSIGLWNSYNTGAVTGSNYAGTIVGYNDDSNIYKCFWDSETSVTEIGVGGMGTMTQPASAYGKTTAEMKTLSIYTNADWDFNSVWLIDPLLNDGYPDFQWKYPPPSSPDLLLVYSSAPQLSWNAVNGATSYKIYSSTDPYADFSAWTLETTVTEATWTDTASSETMKFYLVIAVN